MESLICKCSHCAADLGQFINLWTQIGKSYFSPIVALETDDPIGTSGPTRVGDANTLVAGCQLQDIVCIECNLVIGLKCLRTPVNHVLEDNQLLLRLASINLISSRDNNKAKLVVKRFLKLKETAPGGADKDCPPGFDLPHSNGPSVPPPQSHHQNHHHVDPIDMTKLHAYLEGQRADIHRIDSAGYQIVTAFDSAMDRVEREVSKLQESMLALRRELDGNRDDVSSLKKGVDGLRRDSAATVAETKVLKESLVAAHGGFARSEVVGALDKTVQATSEALAELRESSTDQTAEVSELRRELTLAREELCRVREDRTGLKKHVDEVKKTSRDSLATARELFGRDVSALRQEVRQLRQEVDQRVVPPPPKHAQAHGGESFSAKELEILTATISKIGNRASQIETLQMEFELFKSRLGRLEAAKAMPEEDVAPAPSSRRSHSHLPPPPPHNSYADSSMFPHEDDDNVVGQSEPRTTRRKRSSTNREQASEQDSTPLKRLAFSSELSGPEIPDYTTPTEWPPTSPIEESAPARGKRTGPGSRGGKAAAAPGRKAGRGRGKAKRSSTAA